MSRLQDSVHDFKLLYLWFSWTKMESPKLEVTLTELLKFMQVSHLWHNIYTIKVVTDIIICLFCFLVSVTELVLGQN